MALRGGRFLLAVAVVSFFTLLFMGLYPGPASAAKVFRVALGVEPTSLDPHAGLAGSDHDSFKQIFEPLVEVDPQGNAIPALAVSWENPTPKEWVFRLRKNVAFHDGTPFNAAAVEFNIKRLQDPATKSPVADIAKKIVGINVVDDSTIKLTLDAPNVDFPIVMQDRPGMMVSPAAVKKLGADFGRNPVGTGPFVFQSWKEGDSIKLKKNQNYWNKANVFLDEVELKVIPDQSVAVMNLQAGNLDMIISLSEERVQLLEKSKDIKTYYTPILEFFSTYMMSVPPFDKKEVRQALAYAVDREAITKALTFGYGRPATGHLPDIHWAYEGNVNRYPRNIAKAKELLAKAGYPNGVKATLTTIPVPPHNKIAQIVKQQAAEAGIDFTLEMVEPAQAIGKAMKKETNALQLGWSGRASTDATFQSLVHSAGAYNNKNYINPEADKLIERARSVSDIQERKKAYSALQKLVADDMATLVEYNKSLIVAAKSNVKGIKNYLDGKLRLTGISAE